MLLLPFYQTKDQTKHLQLTLLTYNMCDCIDYIVAM